MQSVHQGFKQLLAIVVTTSLIFSIVPPPTRAATEDVHPALAPRHLTGLSQSGYRKPQGTNSASLAKSSALENSPEVRELGPHHSGKKTVVPVAGSYPTKLGTRNSEAESVVKGSPVGDAKIRGAQPLTFIENKGQFDGRVKFQVTNREQTLWLTENGIVFDFLRNKPAQAKSSRPEEQPSREKPAIAGMVSNHRIEQPALPEIERHVVYQDFIGAKKMPIIETKNVQPGAYNYFVGTDPTKWRTDVRAFGEILYKDVWDGVDVKLYGSGPNVEQEFVVQPGADPTKVQVAYRGVDGLQVSEDGSLLIKTVFGELRESKPRIYQEIAGARVAVDGRFNLKSDNVYTFDVGTYSAEYPLVIDPTLLYSTFLGGSSTNTIVGMAVDTSGSTYVAGITASQDFPITSGTLQSGFNVFVTKLNASGSALVYSSILGRGFPVGFFSSGGGGVALDNQGNAYVTGFGSNIVTTANAYSSCSGFDGFLTVLAPAGNQLVYSTCLQSAAPVGLAVDSGGRAFLAGQTGCGLATTSNAFQPNCPAGNSGFLRVFDTTLSGAASLVYSSYLGDPTQSLNTFVGGIALDSFGKAYITGQIYSSTSNSGQFPTTPGAFRTTLAACTPTPSGQNQSYCQWPYVAKFDTTAQGANSLTYSTYIGYVGQSTMTGDGIPFIMPLNMGIAVDGSGNAYITGGAGSTYPTTAGAYQTMGSGTFVTKLNASGSNLVYSTFLPTNTYPFGGGTPLYTSPFHLFPPVIGFPIAVDAFGQVYISGNTTATNYPVTSDAFQSRLADSSILGGGGDAFLTILNSAGSGLVYSSYLGGCAAEQGKAVAVDQIGDVYVAGQTKSLDFPVTASAFQPTPRGSSNLFVSKFPLSSNQALSVSSITPVLGGNVGNVSPQIFGTGFHAGAAASLNCNGQPIVGANLSVGPGGRFLNTTFNLTAASPGTCDVVVTNPDGTSVTLSQAFAVQQGGGPNIQIYVTGLEVRKVPPEVAVGPADTVVFATTSNIGNVDSSKMLVTEPVPTPFSLTSVSPAGVTDLASLTAGSEAAWNGPLAAGTSRVFTSTATTLSSTSTDNLVVSAHVIDQNDLTGYATCLATGGVAMIPSCPVLDLPIKTACVQASTDCAEAFPSCEAEIEKCEELLVECNKKAAIILEAKCVLDNCKGQGSCLGSSPVPERSPADPNSLVGPPGVGGQRWMAGAQGLSYVVYFQNEPTASVPAQQVVVTQPLGTNVNLSTLSLLGITIPNVSGNVQVPIPPGAFSPAAGVNEFTASVDLRPNQTLLVGVDTKLDPATQTVAWTFTSIDPTTGSPPLNPLVGFLPPGAGAFLSFSATPTPGLLTGAQVVEQATIVFQGAQPMSTQVWTNAIDNTAPMSQVQPLPATESSMNFTVQWAGTDIGSGIQDFTIYVSDNGGPFTPFQTNATATSAQFMGQTGHTYGFYSIARDLVGNIESPKTAAEATTLAGNSIDTISPITTVAISPLPNSAGWNNSNVTINLTAADNLGGSGVKQVSYSATGAQPIPTTTVNGSSASFVISSEGISTISFFSTDNAGNVEAPNTLTIKLDKTPPTITLARTPAPNTNGWNNTSVTVSFQCADSLSGLAAGSPPAPTTLSAEGPNQSVIGTCTDVAGNSASATVSAINIDKTPPTVTPARTPAPNANGWNNTNVTVSFQCADSLSGLAAGSPPAPTILSTDAANQSVTGTCTDLAGNSASATVSGINIDKTPPTVACSASPSTLWPPNNKLVPVNASVTVTDSLSGSAGFNLVSVTSNEPDSGQGDIQGFVPGTPSTSGQLRAQRLGSGTGRIYTFNYSGTDRAGNAASCTTSVTVPHDQGK